MMTIAVFTVIGMAILYRGSRSRSVACAAVCAHCGYDLRGYAVVSRCSECGRDLTVAGTVRTHTRRASRRTVTAGLLLIALPWALVALQRLNNWVGPHWERLRSTSSLIAALDTPRSPPWAWDEVNRRLAAGHLSEPQAVEAVGQLLAYLQHQYSDSFMRPLAVDRFYSTADRAGLITAAQHLSIAQAMYGEVPELGFPQVLRPDQPNRFGIHAKRHWSSPDECCDFSVQSLSIAGNGIALRSILGPFGPGSSMAGFWAAPAGVPDGNYQATLVIQTRVQSLTRPAAPPTAQWAETITVPAVVYKNFGTVWITPPAARLLQVRTDAKADPTRAFSIGSAEALCYSDVTTVIIRITVEHVPIHCFVTPQITVGGQRHSCQAQFFSPDTPSCDCYVNCELGSPGGRITAADVELVPEIEAARKAGLEQVWGKTIAFKDVPLHRRELGFSLIRWRREQRERDRKAATRAVTPTPVSAAAATP